MTVIRIVAAVVADERGRLLLVRKRGTTAFMQPGGKPEAGETPAETVLNGSDNSSAVRCPNRSGMQHATALGSLHPTEEDP